MSQQFVPADRFPLATVGDVIQYLGRSWAVVGVLQNLLILAPAEEHVTHPTADPVRRERPA